MKAEFVLDQENRSRPGKPGKKLNMTRRLVKSHKKRAKNNFQASKSNMLYVYIFLNNYYKHLKKYIACLYILFESPFLNFNLF